VSILVLNSAGIKVRLLQKGDSMIVPSRPQDTCVKRPQKSRRPNLFSFSQTGCSLLGFEIYIDLHTFCSEGKRSNLICLVFCVLKYMININVDYVYIHFLSIWSEFGMVAHRKSACHYFYSSGLP
jgi:hypothetical protein